MKRTVCLLIASLLLLTNIFAQIRIAASITSPDQKEQMDLGLDSAGVLYYQISFNQQPFISWSALGLITAGSDGTATVIDGISKPRLHKEKFPWPLGEDDTIDNTYNEGTLDAHTPSLSFTLDLRAYNGSIAFRYSIKGADSLVIKKELTEFKLPASYRIYQYNQESVFTPTAIDTLHKTCDLPATLTNDQAYLSIGEAGNDNYTKAELKSVKGGLWLSYPRDTAVKIAGSSHTPWRTISMANTAIGLHHCSELFLKLCPPATTDITKTIRPGKLIRSALTTQAGLDCIDFAAKHAFQYVLFDAGWYGAEFRTTSDPTKVIPAIDLPAVIRHGKEKGIGIILYVNYVGLRLKLDTILPLFKQWGVSGFKFGFVDGLTENGIRWLAAAIKKVNDAGFILDIHDNYKPTGLSRTWPALLTQEGIRGDENSPDAFHTTVLPFTRFLAGPADFTFCYPNDRNKYTKNLKVSMAQQLALTVIFFSPLQSIFWYGNPNDYTNEGDIEFFAKVPTVWNESHYLAGDIGKGICVARRKGNTWFIGSAAGLEDWKTSVRLDCLSPGKVYTASIYEDDHNGHIRKRTSRVKKGDLLSIDLQATGGQSVILQP